MYPVSKYHHISISKSHNKSIPKKADILKHDRESLFMNHVRTHREVTTGQIDKWSYRNPELKLRNFSKTYGVTFVNIGNDTWEMKGDINYPNPKKKDKNIWVGTIRKYHSYGKHLNNGEPKSIPRLVFRKKNTLIALNTF